MPDPISWPHAAPYLLAALVFGYLLGSIPFGIILTKLTGSGDLRKIGSGNIGATNVLRTGKKGLALATLLGDLLKGTIAVWLAGMYGPDTALVAGFGAFIGHCFPLWLKFKGGKGVATYIGILLGFSWVLALMFGIIWLITAFLSRYSSLSALVASLLVPILLFSFGHALNLTISSIQLSEMLGVLSLLLWYRHRENIKRLMNGTESRIGKSA